jgi:hypothetical protein
MTDDSKRRPMHPFVAFGFVVLVAGLVGWVWTEEWRWAATGTGVFVAPAVAAVRDGKAQR